MKIREHRSTSFLAATLAQWTDPELWVYAENPRNGGNVGMYLTAAQCRRLAGFLLHAADEMEKGKGKP